MFLSLYFSLDVPSILDCYSKRKVYIKKLNNKTLAFRFYKEDTEKLPSWVNHLGLPAFHVQGVKYQVLSCFALLLLGKCTNKKQSTITYALVGVHNGSPCLVLNLISKRVYSIPVIFLLNYIKQLWLKDDLCLWRGFSMETLRPHEYDLPLVRGGHYHPRQCRVFL